MKHTKEEIERYRQAVIDEMAKYDPNEYAVASETEIMKTCTPEAVDNYMDFNTPEECAAMFLM